jgi:hypothetical protein
VQVSPSTLYSTGCEPYSWVSSQVRLAKPMSVATIESLFSEKVSLAEALDVANSSPAQGRR